MAFCPTGGVPIFKILRAGLHPQALASVFCFIKTDISQGHPGFNLHSAKSFGFPPRQWAQDCIATQASADFAHTALKPKLNCAHWVTSWVLYLLYQVTWHAQGLARAQAVSNTDRQGKEECSLQAPQIWLLLDSWTIWPLESWNSSSHQDTSAFLRHESKG